MHRIYDFPEYYEIAFSFRDIQKEVEVIEELVKRHSRIPARRVLEIGCGSAPHIAELVRRGYAYVGIDRNEAMLAAARKKASELGILAELWPADLVRFTLPEPVDLALVLMGSLYVKNTQELRFHFDALSGALRPGGLYILDWCVDFVPATDMGQSWVQQRDGIQVVTTYRTVSLDRVEQTYRETVIMEVDDHGEHLRLTETAIKRAIYPQEFLLFIAARADFEFVGWWNDWDLDQSLDGRLQRITRPITALRRI